MINIKTKTMGMAVVLTALLCGGCSSYKEGDCILIAPVSYDTHEAERGRFIKYDSGAYWYMSGFTLKSATDITHNVTSCDT